MKIITSVEEFRTFRHTLQGSVGFVPTMGALHKGHLSLVEKSNQYCDYTIVSIFVNPQQFAEHEDLDTYPQNIDHDIKLLSAFTVDAVFLPHSHMMYPENYSTYINETDVSLGLEGKSRPTFFRGVATIVSKLFNIVQPSHSFFGEKDAQQLRVISKMVEDLNYPIDIVPCPIIREDSGLAMSSRNKYLNEDAKQKASVIYRAISHGKKLLKNGEKNYSIIKDAVEKIILAEELADIDYVSIASSKTLKEFSTTIDEDALISVAVNFDGVRLIDNIVHSSG